VFSPGTAMSKTAASVSVNLYSSAILVGRIENGA
jgi:hypothetical protein